MKSRSPRLETTFYRRRSILRQRDLVRLTASMKRLGDDLQTPVTVETANPSVVALAQVLEETRCRLSQQVQALAEARQWSEMLIQSVTEGIITCDASWRVVAFSEGAARITGWDREAALGKPLDAVLPLTAEAGHLGDLLPPDGARRSVTVRDRGGAAIPLAVARAVSTNEGLVTIVIRDISEETSRRRTQSVFLANMSHEFRTPLAGMEASVEVLQKNLDTFSTAETRQLVSSIHLSLSMLHQLIDNLLESSKLEAHHFALN
ncbi:MAG: PAS domain S-box protein, partial [Anaerolineae bacterium]|nr:PAS domain S-box protein [Anaerolineae bacterium]